MTRKTLLERIWEEEKVRFNHPALRPPRIEETPTKTAMLNLRTRKVCITGEFVDELSRYMDEEEALRGILRHEIGHWAYFPHTLATQISLLSEAQRWFGEKTDGIYRVYCDLANEGALLHHGLAGNEILKLRDTLSKMNQKDPCMNRILLAMYAHAFGDDPPKLTKTEEKVIETTRSIPFINLSINEHLSSLYLFGKAYREYVEEERHDMAIIDASDDDINRALSDILRQRGLRAFQTAKGYIKSVRPSFKDPFSKPEETPAAGTAPGDFEPHDELIPVYKRWAASYGRYYITGRPIVVDEHTRLRCGVKEYEIGDPAWKVDIFASKGIVGIPFITKTINEEEETFPNMEWKIPDLNLGIDSSGSMDHPTEGAAHIISACILGETYHLNGANIGGWNFSTDIAYLSPSRDLDAFYSLMCAYWGGGTVPDFEKLRRFFASEHNGGEIKFIPEDRLLDLVPEEEKKEFIKKSLHIDMKKAGEKLEKLDNVLITDGYISNPTDVIEHLSQMAQVTRNFVFITDKASYEQWGGFEMPNTWVYLAQEPRDLIGLAIGKSKTIR